MTLAAPQFSEALPIWRKVYRLGPALLYLPMIAGGIAYSPWKHYDGWPVYVTLLCGPVGLTWHSALIATERGKPFYLPYLLLNMVVFPGIAMFGMYQVATE